MYPLISSGVFLIVIINFVHSQKVNCSLYKNNLANAISEFSSCAIHNARPITFCEACVDNYLTVLESYKNFSTFADDRGICINDYINLDRLQIVETLYQNSLKLWDRAKCYECFEVVNNTITNSSSIETRTFNDLLNTTLKCIERTANNETIYCKKCMDSYLALNDYYISISNFNEKIGMCMDIVDLMNGTRVRWGEKCCEYRKNKEYIFLGTTATVCVLTLLFYIFAKLCTDMKKPKIFRQSRLADSINQLNSPNG